MLALAAAGRNQGNVTGGKLGREPTDEETAAATELEVREVRAARDIARVVTSLDRPVGGEDETTLGALLASDASAPHEEVETAARDDALAELATSRELEALRPAA